MRQGALKKMNGFAAVIMPESYKLSYAASETGEYGFVLPKEKAEVFPAARGGKAAFQIIMSSGSEYAADIGSYGWFSQNPDRVIYRLKTICAFKSEMHIEGPSADKDGTLYADILLSSETAEKGAFEPCGIFVEVDIPEDAEAGKYDISFEVFSRISTGDEEKLPLVLKARIEVFDYVMKPDTEKRYHLDLWQHNSNISRKHEVPLYSEKHFEIMEKYLSSLASLGQKAVTVIASDIPWAGQRCAGYEGLKGNLYEYSMISSYKKEDGTFEYDWSVMDRYISLCSDVGIDSEIEVFGLLNIWCEETGPLSNLSENREDSPRIRYLDLADGKYKYMRDGADIDGFIISLHNHFKDEGLIEKVRIAADEPSDEEKFRRSLEHIHEIAPDFRFKVAINHSSFVREFGREVDDYAPFLESLCCEYDRFEEYRKTLSGKRFIWYICCGPGYPNTFLHSPLTESYILGVITSLAGFEGMLRWAYTCWTEDPRALDSRSYHPLWAAGDTHLVYPSAGGDVLLSLRYKALKKGIELSTLLEEAKERGKNDVREKVFSLLLKQRDIRKLYETAPPEELWSTDESDYLLAERLLLSALSE